MDDANFMGEAQNLQKGYCYPMQHAACHSGSSWNSVFQISLHSIVHPAAVISSIRISSTSLGKSCDFWKFNWFLSLVW